MYKLQNNWAQKLSIIILNGVANKCKLDSKSKVYKQTTNAPLLSLRHLCTSNILSKMRSIKWAFSGGSQFNHKWVIVIWS